LTTPVCKLCGQPMVLIDNTEQEWFCHKDNLYFYARDQRWSNDNRSVPTDAQAVNSPKISSSVWNLLRPLHQDGGHFRPLTPTTREISKISPPWLIPVVTVTLIAINVFAFYLEETKGGSQNLYVLLQLGAVSRSTIVNGQYYRLLTADFLHIGPAHLISNMYALFIIGWNLERVYGHTRFLMVYLLSGLIGSMVSAFTLPIGIVSAGASGSIIGCLAALIILQSRYSHISFGVRLGSAVLSLFYNLVSGLAPGSGIDIAAHLGGAIGGIILPLLVSPPASFSQHINAQTNLMSTGLVDTTPNSAQQVVEETSAISKVRSKSTRRPLKIVAALVIIVLVVVGAYFAGSYPSALLDGPYSIELHSSVGYTSGSVRVVIAGTGEVMITAITVTDDPALLRLTGVQLLSHNSEYLAFPFRVQLPSKLALWLQGFGSPYSTASYSTMTITIQGTWSHGIINVPVNAIISTKVKWASQMINANPATANPLGHFL